MACSAPNPQLSPTDSGRAWEMLTINASRVCPDSRRPLSVSVADTMSGSSSPVDSLTSSSADMAALALRVSNMVSSSIRSAPARASASICSR